MGWITTTSGGSWDWDQIFATKWNVHDLVDSMSRRSRFNGQGRFFLSSAAHCLNVAAILPAPLRIFGLVHDIADAVLPEVPGPWKAKFFVSYGQREKIAYSEMEKMVRNSILLGLGIPDLPDDGLGWGVVKAADEALLFAEAEALDLPTKDWGIRPRWNFVQVDSLEIEERPMPEVRGRYLRALAAELERLELTPKTTGDLDQWTMALAMDFGLGSWPVPAAPVAPAMAFDADEEGNPRGARPRGPSSFAKAPERD